VDSENRALRITDESFEKFREFFYRKTGIFFEDSKRYFVDKRLIERIEATKSDDFRSYFALLRFEAAGLEMQQLINLMTVNETYFFREDYQFRALVRSILPELCTKRTRSDTLRIWSIPSSTGEEPYSIAIYLLEHWPQIASYDVEIVASDIDSNALAAARKGIYEQRSLRDVPPDILERHFTPQPNGKFQISTDLRASIHFTSVNLANNASTASYRNFDIIFCRNLLIYFDDLSRRAAAETFYEALRPGGFVCLGHSESMSRISSLFRVRKFPEAIVYQKDC
jgi:chemotaxis protein methyltransferase CheR